jgi:spore coat protein U-like protein
MSVTASVASNCTMTTSNVLFGAYDPLGGANVTSAGGIAVTCTKGSVPSVTLTMGGNPSGGLRRMTNGTDFLQYQLYKPTTTAPAAPCPAFGSGTVWDTTVGGTFNLTAAPSKATRNYNVCGQIAGAQDVGTGSYTDSVDATVNF